MRNIEKFCPKCGAENSNDALYCSSCEFQFSAVYPTKQKPKTAYAGFWSRFIALLIDMAILAIGGAIIGGITGGILGFILGASGITLDSIQAIVTVIGLIIGIVLNWLYYTLLESSRQATIGKMAMGIIVADSDGNPISFGRANRRYWGKIISSLTFMIGFIMAGFTQKKQALHDIIAGTLVVKK